MSTYYSYFLRAPLKDTSVAGVEQFREIAAEVADVYFDIESGPMDSVSGSPHFGKSTIYEGESFEFHGIDLSDGILRIGVFASNLERSDADYDDASRVGEPDTRQRIEKLMAFLSVMTSGAPGDIQGSFGSEYDEYLHGHPIIRCADGGLRILRTDWKDDYDWYQGEGDPRERYEGPVVTITDRIPGDLTREYSNEAFLVDIHDKVVAQLRLTDISAQKPLC